LLNFKAQYQKNIAAPHEAKPVAKSQNQIDKMRVVKNSVCHGGWQRIRKPSNERRAGGVWHFSLGRRERKYLSHI